MVGRWLWLPLFSLFPVAASADEVPLPTGKSIILSKQGTTYFVEGRQTIGWGTEISIQKEVRIVGRPDAVLVVEGSLQIHGIAGGEVILDNLCIEPGEKFDEIRLDTVLFVGGRVKSGEKPVTGLIVVENSDLGKGVPFEVAMTGGAVNFLDSTFLEPVRITGVAPEGKRCTLKLSLNGCFHNTYARRPESQRNAQSGFEKGLFLTGVPDVLVRNCRLAGDRSEFVDCGSLTFDGNRVNAGAILFKQTQPGGFKDTKIQKTDVYTGKLIFEAPPGKQRDQIPVDKCWFQGVTKKEEIADRVIEDGNDNPDCGVVVVFRKIMERPLELAGKHN
jgi:hypothetical protein